MDKLLMKCAHADPTNYANGSRFVVFYYGYLVIREGESGPVHGFSMNIVHLVVTMHTKNA